MVAWVFLNGFSVFSEKKIFPIDDAKITVALESVEIFQGPKILEEKHFKLKSVAKLLKVNKKIITPTKGIESLDDHSSIEHNEFDMPLDLSLPFKSAETSDYLIEKKWDHQNEDADLFDNKRKKKSRALELDGGLLMSPEPEMEKRKTVDGAGIVINIKP